MRIFNTFLVSAGVLLGTACSSGTPDGSSSGSGGASSGGGSSGGASSGGSATGGSSTGGNASGGRAAGGSATGGSAAGGNATGGNAGGDGGAQPEGTGGYANPLENYPAWVPGCMQSRQLAPCPTCLGPECIVCAFGTVEEAAAAGADCGDPADYDAECSCSPCGTGNGLCNQ